MKKYFQYYLFLLLLIFLTFNSCSKKISPHENVVSKTESPKASRADSIFRVYKIDSINNYYLIYARQNKALFKIVSKKETIPNCKRINVNSDYRLSLNSIWNQKILIGGVNVSPSVTPHVTCLSFDESTKICLEKDSINDLYRVKNIKGLCLIKE